LSRLFKSESHYMSTMAVLVGAYTLYMSLLFHKDWATASSLAWLVDAMAAIVPAIRGLREHVAACTPYWGLFYSFFWLTVPIYWVLGFAGARYLSPIRYQRLVVDTTVVRVVSILVLISIGAVFAFLYPWLSFGFFINQMSNFLPKLMLSWFVVASTFYFQAQVFRVLLFKLASNKNR
jgi:hypothetical protein